MKRKRGVGGKLVLVSGAIIFKDTALHIFGYMSSLSGSREGRCSNSKALQIEQLGRGRVRLICTYLT